MQKYRWDPYNTIPAHLQFYRTEVEPTLIDITKQRLYIIEHVYRHVNTLVDNVSEKHLTDTLSWIDKYLQMKGQYVSLIEDFERKYELDLSLFKNYEPINIYDTLNLYYPDGNPNISFIQLITMIADSKDTQYVYSKVWDMFKYQFKYIQAYITDPIPEEYVKEYIVY